MAQQKWVNKRSIMKDLSLTQGNVLIDHNKSIGITDNDKPPAYLIVEETEEKYFADCVGDGITREPDYEAIQKYISLVNNIGGDTEENEEDKNEKVLQISKNLMLNPHAALKPMFTKKSELQPATDVNDNKISQKEAKILTEELKCTINKPPKKGRKERNAAIASILKVYAGVAPMQTKQTNQISLDNSEVKLLKPTDFMPEENILVDFTPLEVDSETTIPESSIPKDSIRKVSDWMNGNSKISPVLSTTNMFRKKAVSSVVTPPSTPSNNFSSPSTKASSPKETKNGYQPSGVADAFYKKFKENCEIREAVKEDIWTRAQKEMKALDLKKEKEARSSGDAVNLKETVETSNGQVKIVFDNGVEKLLPASICLPQHRHLLTGDCDVCKVLCEQETEPVSLSDEQ